MRSMSVSMMKTDVCIIGGGAAGMAAAVFAARRGLRTLVVEKNPMTGKKLRITGKGRCNVTNNCSPEDCMRNIPQNPRFLFSALNRFPPADAMAFFEELGVALKTERGNRVFPESDSAHQVANALEKAAKAAGARILQAECTGILTEEGRVAGLATTAGEIPCRAVILCTGGLSYPLTGSDGKGYDLARALGHSVVQPKASLVPLNAVQDFCGEMQGLALKNVRMRAYNKKNKVIFDEQGEMLFTHFGISGPLVLSASASMRDFEKDSYRVSIDLKPALDEKTLDARILRDFEKYANKNFENALTDLAPRLLIPVLVKLSGIPADRKVHSVTKAERRQLLELFKDLRIDIESKRPVDEAIITSGGIKVSEVAPGTMESKLVPGLYFAGEVLDVDAYTGGFNLQIAWSTACAAANSISLEE